MRRQLEVLHRRSIERGHLLQAITGIPNFYLQFGYEFALAVDGGRIVERAEVPALPSGAREPFSIRLATEEDLPALARIDRLAGARSLISCVRDATAWRYELNGRSSSSMLYSAILVLEKNPVSHDHSDVVGYAVLGSGGLPGGSPTGTRGLVRRFEILDGVSWETSTNALLRYLTSAEMAAQPAENVQFLAGEHHPAYSAAPRALARTVRPWAWYVRVPNLTDLLLHVAPVLESRLASSTLSGHSGQLTISFYRTALRLLVDNGRVTVQDWPDPNFRTADACFPGFSFLKLVLGYRTIDELEFASPDCQTREGIPRRLLDALFPRCDSTVWPIG